MTLKDGFAVASATRGRRRQAPVDHEGLPAVVVGLDEPRPDTEARLPATLEGYRVVVQIVGTIEAL